jgi:hypothetical protein
VNGKYIERQKYVNLLEGWLQEDGGWQKQVNETCKKAYRRMSFLTKLRYAGVKREDLIHNYKQFVRSSLEYCSVAIHSSLTEAQSNSLEHCQAVALRIILQDSYETYEQSLLLTGLEKFSARRAARCLDFSLKCIKHEQNQRFFPRNPNLDNLIEAREREEFIVNFARTEQYRRSTIPSCQRLLNDHFWMRGSVGAAAGSGMQAGAGIGEVAGV